MKLRRPAPATVLAGAALFVALGGPAEAQRAIGLKNNSVTSAKIRNGTIATRDISSSAQRSLRRTPDNGVRSAQVADGSLSGVDLVPGAIAGDRLAANAVGGANVVDNSLGTADIANDAIDTQEIRDNSIRTDDLGSNSVDSDEVRDGTLAAKDVGRFTGRLTDLDFGIVGLGDCKAVASTSLTPLSGNQDLRDDAIVITPQPSFPSTALTLLAKPVAANQIEVTVCNVGGAADINLGPRSFQYVSFDAVG